MRSPHIVRCCSLFACGAFRVIDYVDQRVLSRYGSAICCGRCSEIARQVCKCYLYIYSIPELPRNRWNSRFVDMVRDGQCMLIGSMAQRASCKVNARRLMETGYIAQFPRWQSIYIGFFLSFDTVYMNI